MKIVCSAILDKDKRIFYGKRHADALFIMYRWYQDNPEAKYKDQAVQGFIDGEGNFYTREEAKIIATENGQAIEDHDPLKLYSEDLY